MTNGSFLLSKTIPYDKGVHGQRPKVLLVLTCNPTYRQALHARLSVEPNLRFYFCVDPRKLARIETVPLPDEARAIRIKFRSFRSLAWQSGLLKLAALGDFDAWILPGDWHLISTWLTALLLRLRGRPVIFWTHGWRRNDSGLKRWVRLAFYRLADVLFLYGDQARAIGRRMGFDDRRMRVIYNSLDYDTQQELISTADDDSAREELREKLRFPDAPVVICCSRLTSSKNFALVIDAIAHLQKQGYPINLLVVGSGPEYETLVDRATKLDIGAVFVGSCYVEEEIARYYSLATVSVVPSAAGLMVVQSIGYGIPVLLGDDFSLHGPESEAVVPGLNGAFFEHGKVESLAKHIIEWISTTGTLDRHRIAASISPNWTTRTQVARIVNGVTYILEKSGLSQDRFAP